MKAVILAGGFGTRISEESSVRPKPMVEIGGMPILWHVMKIYAAHGLTDFVICCGYKGYLIKEYFANYRLQVSDVTFDYRTDTVRLHSSRVEPWQITLVDTGESTMTGGRIKRIREHVGDSAFCCTYGDGVARLNIGELIEFHRQQGTIATLTAVQSPARFGVFPLDQGENKITSFSEKPQGSGAWINGGFFVLEPEVFDYIEGDATSFEREPLERLACEGELSAFRHPGFWQPMDTLRDKNVLEQLWQSGDPPWKVW
jgi:glucose-1-phosphate cytidylyltransferase